MYDLTGLNAFLCGLSDVVLNSYDFIGFSHVNNCDDFGMLTSMRVRVVGRYVGCIHVPQSYIFSNMIQDASYCFAVIFFPSADMFFILSTRSKCSDTL